MTDYEPRIYVACLASYNSGILHGEWLEATDDEDEMQEGVNRVLRTSPEPNVMVECLDCVGDGWVYTDGSVERETATCTTCKGTGQVPSAEEWAIHDHEGLGDIGEYAGLAEVARRVQVAQVAEDHDLPVAVLLEAMSDAGDDDVIDAEDWLSDHFAGSADSWKDFAEEHHEDCGDLESVPDWLKYHIDWESVGREMSQGYNGIMYHGTLYVFYQ